jgi:regulator of protease activity HflC (stomatin/prohibitin superfamily)
MNSDLSNYGFVIDQVLVRYIDVPAEIDQAIEKKVLSEQQVKQQEVEILTQKRSTDASIEKERKEMEFSMEKQKREMETTIQQERMQADFAIEKEKKEAERKIIEGQAAKTIQEYQNSTITPMLIKYKTIDIMQALANSNNTKLIITDGKTPLSLLREDIK